MKLPPNDITTMLCRKAAGVTSTWQLFGKGTITAPSLHHHCTITAALDFNDANEFEDFLSENGTAAGFLATVTHQVMAAFITLI